MAARSATSNASGNVGPVFQVQIAFFGFHRVPPGTQGTHGTTGISGPGTAFCVPGVPPGTLRMTAHSSARASARIGRPLEDGSRDDVSPSRPAAADAHIALQSVSATFLPWLGRAQPIGRRGRHKLSFPDFGQNPPLPLCAADFPIAGAVCHRPHSAMDTPAGWRPACRPTRTLPHRSTLSPS
jgi:hypothetical protein